MAKTFNCGIGMVAIVSPDAARPATEALEAAGETVFEIGRIEAADGATAPVIIDGARDAWAS
jgi:phosphoribosylformylglycinamidine cyclo-ligase